MRTIIRIMKGELQVLFFSPIAWLILIAFAFQVGIEFSGILERAYLNQYMGSENYALSAGLFSGHGGLYTKLLKYLYLYIPLLTMGLISRELSSGSIKLLYSSPVSNFQIVIGKYMSMLVCGLLLSSILFFPVFIASFSINSPDIPLMLTGILGVFLTISAYAAIGIFMSSITKYQVVAVVATLGILAILNFIGGVGQKIDFVRDITYWLSISGRSMVFIDGMISSKDFFYFILIILMSLGLTVVKLQGERLKLSKIKTSARYLSVIVIALALGYISSMPEFVVYYDSTRIKTNTLTQESQEIIKQLKGDLTITTYVNLLDETYSKGSPENRIYDIAEFEKYLRFKPEIEMKYVYYYAKGDNTNLPAEYNDMSLKQIVEKKCNYLGENPKKYLSLDEVLKMDDIRSENGRFARVISSANGKKAILRIYDDYYAYPDEAQISSALKTLIVPSPSVGFVTGHKERSCTDYSEKGYGSFAANNTFRYSLVNNGFNIREITLDSPVADDIDIIVLADMRSEMTKEQSVNFDAYLNRGGNMFILGEPKRQHIMNPIVEKLGLRFIDGIIVSPSNINIDDIIAANITDAAITISPNYQRYAEEGYSIITPSACAVEVIDSTKGFTVTEILKTMPHGSWVEKQTTDFINEKSNLNLELGEEEKSNSVMLYLTRRVNKKEQRIFVIGDADCISTLELSTSRSGLKGSNFTLITETFRNMSYGEYPVEAIRMKFPDDEIFISQVTIIWIRVLLLGIIPLFLLTWCLILLIKRKRR